MKEDKLKAKILQRCKINKILSLFAFLTAAVGMFVTINFKPLIGILILSIDIVFCVILIISIVTSEQKIGEEISKARKENE